MEIKELFRELSDTTDRDAWFYSAPRPVSESGQPTTLMLLLDRAGGEIARSMIRTTSPIVSGLRAETPGYSANCYQ